MTADDLLCRVVDDGNALLFDEARSLMAMLLGGGYSEPQMTDLLTALHERGETSMELAGFADAMRSAAVHVPLTDTERDTLVDTCGTGGDGSGTFNISTAVALVAAAAGATVAKHGNRAVTSRCGSADVLQALGVETEHTPESAAQSLRKHRFAFLLATRMHPAMKVVAPTRRALPFRTVFNLLGPMSNPAGARRQVVGVYSAAAVPLVSEALAQGGHMLHALVVHGAGGLDEMALSGESLIAEVKGNQVRQYTVVPEDCGLTSSSDALAGGDAVTNAEILRGIVQGTLGPARDVVLLNTAAVLLAANRVSALDEGVDVAGKTLDSGHALSLLENLRSAKH